MGAKGSSPRKAEKASAAAAAHGHEDVDMESMIRALHALLQDAGGRASTTNLPELEYDSSEGIQFVDCWTHIGVGSDTKNAVKCTHDTKATSFTAQVFKGSDDVVVDFTVVEPGSVVGVGVLGYSTALEGRNRALGEKELPNSVGLFSKKGVGAVILYNDDVLYGPDPELEFDGITHVQVIFRGGQLYFTVDKKPIVAPKLLALGFGSGRFRMGVSFAQKDQLVVARDPIGLLLEMAGLTSSGLTTTGPRFRDDMKSVNCDRQDLVAVCVKDFAATSLLQDTIDGGDSSSCQFNVLALPEGTDMRFGLMDIAGGNSLKHASNLLGDDLKNSIGISTSGDIFVSSSRLAKLKAIAAGNVVKLELINNKFSVSINGSKVSCSKLEELTWRGKYKFGVSFSKRGQAVCIGEPDDQKLAFVRDQLGDQGQGMLQTNDFRFKDDMRSVDCDALDKVAVCVRDFDATSMTQTIIGGQGNSTCAFTILRLPAGSTLRFGVLDSSGENHTSRLLGESNFNNSLAFTSGGDIILKSDVIDTFRAMKSGDKVTLKLAAGKLSLCVNGTPITSSKLAGLSFSATFRFGVSLPSKGQAVCIGEPEPSAEQFVRSRLETSELEEKTFDGEWSWATGEASKVKITGQEVECTASEAKVVTAQVFEVNKHKEVCSACFKGKFGSFYDNVWECKDSNQNVIMRLCNDCFKDQSVTKTNVRSAGCNLGGGFFEASMFVLQTKNQPITFGLTDKAGRWTMAVKFSPSGAEVVCLPKGEGPLHFDPKLRSGDVVTMRLQLLTGVVLVNGKVVFSCKVKTVCRFGVGFSHRGQALSLQEAVSLPKLGYTYTICSSKDQLMAEGKLADVNQREEVCGQSGVVCSVKRNPIVGLNLLDSSTKKPYWVPRTVLTLCSSVLPSLQFALTPGVSVMRHPYHWKWHSQDGTPGALGVVKSLPEEGMVEVKWPSGTRGIYRYGRDNFYDVIAVPTIGSVVVRNPFGWGAGNIDGNGEGTVTAKDKSGNLTVQWKNSGRSAEHKFNMSAMHVQLATQAAVPVGVSSIFAVGSHRSVGSTSTTDSDSVLQEIEEMRVDSDDIQIDVAKILGAGAFGAVYCGFWDGKEVAIKQMAKEPADGGRQLREILLGAKMHHPNLASVNAWCIKDDKLLLVMTLFKRGNLQKLIEQKKAEGWSVGTGGTLGFAMFYDISIGIARGLKYMATRKPKPFVHRDIKPANILIDENGNPLLTDFGLARSVEDSMTATQAGTMAYMSPEQLNGESVSPGADTYAFGVVMTELLTGQIPFADNVLILMKAKLEGLAPPFPPGIPQNLQQLIESMMKRVPAERLPATTVLKQLEDMARK